MPSAVTDTLFKSGVILMPVEPTGNTLETVQLWGDSFTISCLIVAATILVICNLKNFVMIIPALYETFIRAKGSQNLESRNTLIRARTISAMVLMLPFCLVANRYELLDIDYIKALPAKYNIAATIVVFVAFLIIRFLIGWQIEPKHKGRDAWGIGRRSSHGFFIIMTTFVLIMTAILSLAGASDEITRTHLYYVIGFVYILAVFRRYQIIRVSCNSFTIILYLCALEFFPTGLLLTAVHLF